MMGPMGHGVRMTVGQNTRWLRPILTAATPAYRVAVTARRIGYDRGWLKTVDVEVPVISVGNLTTGGTGKTPMVADLCRRLRGDGHRPAIVSRGYGAGPDGINDEALELAERLPAVPHVQNPDRVAAARVAIDELDAELIVMDDGFQHRRLGRDVDIVLIDCSDPFGGQRLLPAGRMREPKSSLARADAIVLTRAESSVEDLVSEIRRFNRQCPIAATRHAPARLIGHRQSPQPLTSLAGQRVGMLAAIGNPAAFERSLAMLGAEVVATMVLPDHATYDRSARERAARWAEANGPLDRIVCTHKDLVKLQTASIAGVPLVAVQIDLQWLDDPGGVMTKIREALASRL